MYNVITKAGWALKQIKSDKIEEADVEKKYLGFILNTSRMDVRAPEKKLQKTRDAILEILKRKETPVKHLARILIIIISLEPSHGMAARIST